jgi:hypothetical protein
MTQDSRPSRHESSYVAWMRGRQQDRRRHEPVIAQRHAQPDPSESQEVHGQERTWARRHAHEQRLHDSAIAHLRHGRVPVQGVALV